MVQDETDKLFACQYAENRAVACHANICRIELQGLNLMFLKAHICFL